MKAEYKGMIIDNVTEFKFVIKLYKEILRE
ncbi:hypothetical protein LCGC14_2770300 [marine sediment metagenome]|uniref:Uncharacterized protein n=1 Tax=marine sediment metagenome TaxID=412755 RepID=A0A0F8YWB2_9ZZZZ